MSDILVPEANPLFSIEPLVEGRKDLDPLTYSYKLTTPGNYGLDVVLGDDLQINEAEMSCWVNFADGNSRDGVGDVTEVAGINCERHRKNPIVLFDHGKHCQLPIALAEDPNTKQYTVEIRPDTRTAKAKCFFYQGKNGDGLEKNHAQFCYDIFDMLSKKFIRGGSFAYQIIRAERLQPDYTQGTPPGLHLLATRLLELGPTVIPAHQDTVMKMLDMPGHSDIFYKSLQPYVLPRLEMVVGGYDSKAYNASDESHPKQGRFKGKPSGKVARPQGRASRAIDPRYEYTSKMGESKPGEKRKIITRKIPQQHDPSDTPFDYVSRDEYKHESPETQKYFKKREHLRRRGVTPRDVVKRGERRKQTHQRLDKFVQHYRESRKDLPEETVDIKALRAKYSKRLSDGEKGRVTYSESGWEGEAPPVYALPADKPRPKRSISRSQVRHQLKETNQVGQQSKPRNRIPDPPRPKTARPQGRAGAARIVENPKGRIIATGFLRDYKRDPPPAGRKGIKPFHSEEDDYQSLEQGDAPNSSLGQFPAEIDRGQKSQPSDKVKPGKACQILHDGTAQGHELTEKQRGMFGAACNKKGFEDGEKANASVAKQVEQTRFRNRALAKLNSMSKEELAKAPRVVGTGRGMANKDPISRALISLAKKGKKNMENKGLEDATTNPETQERHDLINETDAVGKEMEGPSIKDIRAKYQRKKGVARCLKKSVPGSFMVHVESKYLEAVKSAAGKAGIKCEHGEATEGIHKVRLTGLDDAVHKLAGKYGKPGTIGKKGVEIESDGQKAQFYMTNKRSSKVTPGNTLHSLRREATGEHMGHVSQDSERTRVHRNYPQAGGNRFTIVDTQKHKKGVDIIPEGEKASHYASGKRPSRITPGRYHYDIRNEKTGEKEAGLMHGPNTTKVIAGYDQSAPGNTSTQHSSKKNMEERRPGQGRDSFIREQRAKEQAKQPRKEQEPFDKRDILDLKDDEKAINPPKLKRNIARSMGVGEADSPVQAGEGDPIYPPMPQNSKNRVAKRAREQQIARDWDRTHGKKGLEFNIKIQCPNPEYVIQKAQLFGIGAWEEDGGCVLSGIDEVEIGRFLRQYKIMDDAQVDNLFGGRLAGHKSLKDGSKGMEIHVKDSSDSEELRKKEPKEQPLAQDETPADQAEYTETPGEEYPEDSYTDEYGDEEGYEEEGFEDEGPQEKLGAQILRELHGEMEEFIAKYDEILPLVEHEGISQRLVSKMENTVAELEEIEEEFAANYPEYGGLGDKEMEGGMAPEHEEEGASSEGLPEPDPDEVVEGMSKHPNDEENEETEEGEEPLKSKKKSLPQNQRQSKGFSLLNYELKSVYDASSFLKNLGQTTTLNEDLKFDSYYHGKSLLAIQTRIDDFAAKGSLLPKAHGDATEGEADEVSVNHPNSPSHYTPGKEPMQQHGKGSLLDHYQGGGDAGDALGEDKDTDSHINDPDGPNSVAQPGKDSDHMAYGHDREWPHKGSLLPAPSGDAGEGEPEEVNVNHPSSNPQAKPGTDKDHQWFGKPAEWPHKELAPQGQYYKAIAEAGQYLKALSQCKAYGEALKEQAKFLAKALDPVAAQIEAVGVSKPSGWDPKLGSEPAQPFGKPAEWPHKSLDNYFDGINRTQAKLDALVKLVKTR